LRTTNPTQIDQMLATSCICKFDDNSTVEEPLDLVEKYDEETVKKDADLRKAAVYPTPHTYTHTQSISSINVPVSSTYPKALHTCYSPGSHEVHTFAVGREEQVQDPADEDPC
jgi:hypothetical protein